MPGPHGTPIVLENMNWDSESRKGADRAAAPDSTAGGKSHSASTFVIQYIFTGLVSDTVLKTRDAAVKKTTNRGS